MNIRQGTTFKVPVILIDSTTGLPKTGVLPADVTVYLQKQGGAATLKALDGTNWTEISAANMPGMYDLTLSAADTDTLGFMKFLATNAGAATYRGIVQIIARAEDEIYAFTLRMLALGGANRVSDQEVLDSNKRVTSARIRTYDTAANATAAAQQGNPGTTGLIATYSVAASYTLSGACTMTVTETLP